MATESPGRVTRKLPGLRRVRKARGLSQRQLSALSRVSYVNISRIENGQRASKATAGKLARALGVPVTELIGYGSSRETLLGMADFVRSLGFEPEDFITDVEISSEDVHSLYEATYIKLLRAEQERSVEPLMDRRSLDLVEAVKRLPPGDEKAQLQQRVKTLLEREVAVFQQEAERRGRELREAEQELIGAA